MITVDGKNWSTLYKDPEDQRFWELTYSQGEMQGGGPPALHCISEYTNGVNRVTVELADGTQYKEVYVAWAEKVVRVGEGGSIPFDTRQVVKVINCP